MKWKFEPVLIVSAVKSLLQVGIAFGLELSAEQLSLIMVAIESSFAVFVRSQVTPVAKLNGD